MKSIIQDGRLDRLNKDKINIYLWYLDKNVSCIKHVKGIYTVSIGGANVKRTLTEKKFNVLARYINEMWCGEC